MDSRHRYPEHLVDLALVEARSALAALEIARAGLRSAYEQFVVVSKDGDLPMVPYHGRRLRGTSLLRQLDDWVRRGIAEPAFGEAVGAVVRNPDWLDLSDHWLALLGAGAQMGPFRS